MSEVSILGGAHGFLVHGGFVDGAQTLPKTKNVVFVHGLFADGSCWSKAIARSSQGSSQTDMPGSKPVGSPRRSRRRRNVLRS